MEWKTVVRCGFRILDLMMLPKLLVLENNFFEVFKSDHHGVDLAKLAKLEKLDGRYTLSISGKMNENYKI